MQSNNPIFRSSEEFGGRGRGQMHAQAGHGGPDGWSVGPPGAVGEAPTQQREAARGPMTIDTVVQKSAITLGVVVLAAALTWWLIGDISQGAAGILYPAILIGAGGAFVLSLVNSFKKVVSPALVLAFAALEGVALGAISTFFGQWFGNDIVVGAVLGTFGAFAGTLAVYKFFDIQVGSKFRTFVMAGVFGMVGLALLELVLGFAGMQIGFFGLGTLGMIFSIVGLVLGVFMLVLDFDFIEKGVALGIPERESWRAAFALTVSLVWIYTNLLRLLAIFGDN